MTVLCALGPSPLTGCTKRRTRRHRTRGFVGGCLCSQRTVCVSLTGYPCLHPGAHSEVRLGVGVGLGLCSRATRHRQRLVLCGERTLVRGLTAWPCSAPGPPGVLPPSPTRQSESAPLWLRLDRLFLVRLAAFVLDVLLSALFVSSKPSALPLSPVSAPRTIRMYSHA